MKKIFSLIIALTLLVSVFALSAVAFADGEARTVTVTDLGNAYLLDKVGTDRFIADQENFKGWLTTTADVKSVFTGINFAIFGDDDYDKDAKYDTVRLEYCTGDPRFQDNWVSDEKTLIVTAGGTSFNLKLSGYVAFRYSATYKPTPDAEEKTVVTKEFVLFVEDTTAPVLELGTTLSSKVAEGLTVGKAYTITTSSSSVKVTDSSTYTTTYAIQKLINGQYVEIYNSVDGLSEDYEGKDVAGGTITPSAEDVLDQATYKVIFSATDANGFKGNDLVVEFKVNAKADDVEEENKVEMVNFDVVINNIQSLSGKDAIFTICVLNKGLTKIIVNL